MDKIVILIMMIFCHIIDDYKLQSPVLNMLKQKDYWKENYSEKLYRYDYLCALLMHAFSWTFMISFPVIIYRNFHIDIVFFVYFLLNIMIHAYVDNLKANIKTINLVTDQFIHICQILITFVICVVID